MFIVENFAAYIKEIIEFVFNAPLNRVMIVGVSAQLLSMVTKNVIKALKNKSFNLKGMADYGGMPSSHTSFILSTVFAIGLDKQMGWNSPLFGFAVVVALIILVDAVKFRGNVDQINAAVRKLIEKDEGLKKDVKLPSFIAHKGSEVIGGAVFAVIYTFVFYILLNQVL